MHALRALLQFLMRARVDMRKRRWMGSFFLSGSVGSSVPCPAQSGALFFDGVWGWGFRECCLLESACATTPIGL